MDMSEVPHGHVPWTCPSCGWSNNPQNRICGGPNWQVQAAGRPKPCGMPIGAAPLAAAPSGAAPRVAPVVVERAPSTPADFLVGGRGFKCHGCKKDMPRWMPCGTCASDFAAMPIEALENNFMHAFGEQSGGTGYGPMSGRYVGYDR